MLHIFYYFSLHFIGLAFREDVICILFLPVKMKIMLFQFFLWPQQQQQWELISWSMSSFRNIKDWSKVQIAQVPGQQNSWYWPSSDQYKDRSGKQSRIAEKQKQAKQPHQWRE